LASLGTVALGSLLIAAMVGWLAYVSTTQALRREATKRVEAESATTRAEQNMQLSLGALEEIFLALAPPQQVPGERQLEGQRPYPPPRPPGPGRDPNDVANRPPGHQAKEAQLLQTVLEFYERFAATNATNTRLKREAARSYRRVGDIHARENELSAAAESYQHACTLFAELTGEGADHGNALAELIETKLRHADALGVTEPAGREGELLAEAAQMGQTLAEEFPEVGRFKLLLAHVHRNRAKALQRQGEDSAAEKNLRQAAELATDALDCADVARIGVSELAMCQAALARFLVAKQRTSEALQVIENSISTLEAAPPSREIHDALAEQHDLFDEVFGPKGPPRRRRDGPPPPAPRP
jgi:tetratricopeptide (TPR) repeat protein